MTADPLTYRSPLALGELLRSAGLVQTQQLDAALALQQSSGEKLGDALTHLAIVDSKDTATTLMVQQQLRNHLSQPTATSSQAVSACLRVGELLVAHGDISRDVLDQALQQQTGSTPLGSLLLQMGAVNAAALDHVLRLQKRLLSAVLHAGIGFTFAFSSHTAAAGSTAQLIITASVATKVRFHVQSHPSSFTLGPQDIARGYVDVLQPSEFDISTNSAEGVALEFHGADSGAGIESVQVMGVNQDFRMAPSGGIVLLQGHWQPNVQRNFKLNYRLWLGAHAQAGIYAWPLAMGVSAL